MSWKKLLAESKVHAHKTSRKELDDLRAVIVRDLEDAAIQELSDDRRFATAYWFLLRHRKSAKHFSCEVHGGVTLTTAKVLADSGTSVLLK